MPAIDRMGLYRTGGLAGRRPAFGPVAVHALVGHKNNDGVVFKMQAVNGIQKAPDIFVELFNFAVELDQIIADLASITICIPGRSRPRLVRDERGYVTEKRLIPIRFYELDGSVEDSIRAIPFGGGLSSIVVKSYIGSNPRRGGGWIRETQAFIVEGRLKTLVFWTKRKTVAQMPFTKHPRNIPNISKRFGHRDRFATKHVSTGNRMINAMTHRIYPRQQRCPAR